MRRVRINEHSEDIIFVGPLECPLTRKLSLWFAVFKWIAVQTNLVFVWMARAIHSKKNNCHPFKWLGLSVWKKNVICLNGLPYLLNGLGYPFEKNCHPLEQLGLSVWKKLLSIRTAMVFEKEIVERSSDWSYLVKDEINIVAKFPSQRISLLTFRVKQSVILELSRS